MYRVNQILSLTTETFAGAYPNTNLYVHYISYYFYHSLRFDKRAATVCKDDYLATKVNTLPFVLDGQLLEMTIATDVLIREISAVVSDVPPPQLGLTPQRGRSESRFGLSDEQVVEATKAIEIDDAVTLRRIIDEKLKESPQMKDVLLSATQSGRPGQVIHLSFNILASHQKYQQSMLITGYLSHILIVDKKLIIVLEISLQEGMSSACIQVHFSHHVARSWSSHGQCERADSPPQTIY